MELLQWSIYCLIKKSSCGAIKMNMSKKELPKKLQNPIIRKFEKRKVNSPCIDNIWRDDFAYMQLISKLNKGLCFL